MSSKKKRRAKTGGKHVIQRVAGGRFAPGVSANPDGPKPGFRHFTSKVKIVLERVAEIVEMRKKKKIDLNPHKLTYEELLADRIVRDAVKGNDTLAKLIWNYLDGMPAMNFEPPDDGIVLPAVFVFGADDRMAGVMKKRSKK